MWSFVPALSVLGPLGARQTLVEHLLVQNAPLAAARLAALLDAPQTAENAGGEPAAREQPSSLPRFTVHLADVAIARDDASAAALAEQLRGAAILSLDAEWQPDAAGGCSHPASLVQLALASEDGTPIKPYWIIDLEVLGPPNPSRPQNGDQTTSQAAGAGHVSGAAALDDALAIAFASCDMTVLGYGFQTDLDKIALRSGWRFTNRVTRLIDLRDACAAAGARGGCGGERVSSGLSADLARWIGQQLDKTEQISEWHIRPLRAAQIRYAAADAACLLPLYAALALVRRDVLLEVEARPSVAPTPTSSEAASAPSTQGLGEASETAGHKARAVALTSEELSVQHSGLLTMNALAGGNVACELVEREWGEEQIRQSETARAEAIVAAEAAALETTERLESAVLADTWQASSDNTAVAHGARWAVQPAASSLEAGGGGSASGHCAMGTIGVNAICLIVTPIARQSGSKVGSGKAAAARESSPKVGSDKADGARAHASYAIAADTPAMAISSEAESGPYVLLTPSNKRVDLKWLAMALSLPRKRLRMATPNELITLFGSVAGAVPPVPLRWGVRVLAMPSIARASRLVCGAGHRGKMLIINEPRFGLPALCKTAADILANTPAPTACATEPSTTPTAHRESFASPVFEWLPPPETSLVSLDDAISRSWEAEASRLAGECEADEADKSASLGPLFGGAARQNAAAPPPPRLRLLMDCSLSPVARKLRMVGIDTRVAGEVIRQVDEHNPRPHPINGLMRVKIEPARADAEYRRAAAEGRLVVTAASRVNSRAPATISYRLLGETAEEQFTELLTVFGLERAVHAGESRCGICNSMAWITLAPDKLHGRVPADVIRVEREFYQCGTCRQIFWPGSKYTTTIQELKDLVSKRDVDEEAIGAGERLVRGGQIPFDDSTTQYLY